MYTRVRVHCLKFLAFSQTLLLIIFVLQLNKYISMSKKGKKDFSPTILCNKKFNRHILVSEGVL